MNLQDLLKQYQPKNSKDIYKDKLFCAEGINYNNYIGLRFETIKLNEIKTIYGIDGWYILWYLMSNGHQRQYIKTTIEVISIETKIDVKKVKKILIDLQNKNEIHIETYTLTGKVKSIKNITTKDIIEIVIGYSNPNIKTYNRNGYKAIPIEYINSILPTLEPTEWAILCILIVRFSFFSTPDEIINPNTGEIIYPYTINHYAFPTQDQIAEFIGISDTTVKRYIDKLLKNKYKLIHIINKDIAGKQLRTIGGKVKTVNYQYGVNLLERWEYNMYHTINVEDTREAKEKALVKKNGFDELIGTENQYILRSRDYLHSIDELLIKSYNKAIDGNIEEYKEWYEKTNMIIKKKQ